MDERLRRLEREATAGDLSSEVRALTARLRAGDLGEASLALAALLGHKPAQVALGARTFVETRCAVTELLPSWGHDACVRGAIAAARAVPLLARERS